ncbi:ABC transporter substrate-binding protein [Blastococcus sp. TF02A-26]|uniref:ABC transporter substrate-binding protein n=1 Tax=Blastococcus sp. TF02A-26 TaxID=2250577 RepID=UPI000DEAFD40|nr:ABC transporter substrate-binding protein [Blastococcus sp. TF02A-26]RBY84367.1 ABC transporter substrate-binding protein [Blastococcus sp. TF02A-26]
MHRRWHRTLALLAAAALALTACGGGSDDDGGGGSADAPVGDPVAGGTAKIGLVSEPRTLDPAFLGNNLTTNSLVGSALYGALFTQDPVTGDLSPAMAESLETTDGGTTYRMTLQEGLTFSDGSPLDAEAVRANWARAKDIGLRAPVLAVGLGLGDLRTVDAVTFEFTLNRPTPNFGGAITTSALNWIGAPAALTQGQAAFDANPIGAGPFVLESWTRGGELRLLRNDRYWDAPKPYLDGLTLSVANDAEQRYNALQSGATDAILNGSTQITARAEEAGFDIAAENRPNGGTEFLFNTTVAPFDDVRAREAVYKAIDLEAVSQAVFEGQATAPSSWFAESSPFYTGDHLPGPDPERAEELFAELAAEGKPVSFTIVTFPTPDSTGIAQSIQTQLSAYDDVTVEIDNRDFAGATGALTGKSHQAITAGVQFVDPEPQWWAHLHSESFSNYSGIEDAELDEALDAARAATDEAERRDAYQRVEERTAEIYPAVLIAETEEVVLTRDGRLQGVVISGAGTVLVDGMWLNQ